jgi:electron transfer flavoprotein-quinone oxidoreductase
MLTVDGTSKREKQKKIWRDLGPAKEKLRMARDLYRAWRVMK